jgi:hypothetical protein
MVTIPQKRGAWLCVAVLLVGLLLAAGAAAQQPPSMTGVELLERCRTYQRFGETDAIRNAKTGYETGYCAGVVLGALDTYAVYQGSGFLSAPPFCLPTGGIQVDQGVRILVRYLEMHPERLHLQLGDLLINAMQQAFPCPGPAPQPARQR